ncbi:hypothetical protein BFW38_06500 [Terasakiispira papahanaumokuakeensis]|uniref:bAvd-like domain-containing protein n=1 Tax=Terasakiispira papahanaumokuakeensis TaxID=197479 RepID=A0A1E2V9A9_9GAMM|nr:hypothetical protein BFW38_06500 [Terasakiispira papahanaumokuakeensis]
MGGSQFILRQKLEDFSFYFFPIIDRFPTREKWALCSQIKNCVYRLMRRCIQVEKSRDKRRFAFEMDVDMELLRYLIRLAHKSRYLNSKRLQTVSQKVGELGRILGGMLRSFGVQP